MILLISAGERNSAKFATLATAQRLLVFKSDRVNHTFGNNIKCFYVLSFRLKCSHASWRIIGSGTASVERKSDLRPFSGFYIGKQDLIGAAGGACSKISKLLFSWRTLALAEITGGKTYEDVVPGLKFFGTISIRCQRPSTELFANIGPEKKLSTWSSLICNSVKSYFTESDAGPDYTLLYSAVEYVQGKIHGGVLFASSCPSGFVSLPLPFNAPTSKECIWSPCRVLQ